jgi:hypothetical protein
VAGIELLVARRHAPEPLEPGDEPLDGVAPPVRLTVEAGGPGPVRPARDDGRGPLPARGAERPSTPSAITAAGFRRGRPRSPVREAPRPSGGPTPVGS